MCVSQYLILNATDIVNTSDPTHRFVLDGLTYAQVLTDESDDEWLHLLREATPFYEAQPYRQLASMHQSAGHDRQVRATLIAQRSHQLSLETTSDTEWLWGRLTWWTLGYGYRPWLALLWLLGTVMTAVALTLALGGAGLVSVASTTDVAESCTRTEQILYAVDTTLPLVTTNVADTCTTSATTAGQWLDVIGLLAQIIGWAFATLFVAGFTSAVRKT